MTTQELHESLAALFGELIHGAGDTGYVLNAGDGGLLRSLDRLTAADASVSSHGGASIAAHVDHVCYGLSLMNRWAAGERPFEDADWSQSWEIGPVTDSQWATLRASIRDAAEAWRVALERPRELASTELNGVIASVAHLAYHLGAIRQINHAARGPREGSPAA